MNRNALRSDSWQSDESLPQLYTDKEVGAALRVSAERARALAKAGGVDAITLGPQTHRFTAEQVEQIIQHYREPAVPTSAAREERLISRAPKRSAQ